MALTKIDFICRRDLIAGLSFITNEERLNYILEKRRNTKRIIRLRKIRAYEKLESKARFLLLNVTKLGD